MRAAQSKRFLTGALAFLLLVPLFPSRSRIVYADPIGPAIALTEIKPLPALKDRSYALLEPLEPIWINKLRPYGTYPNDYAFGNCTIYVASRLPVPNSMGNANQWDNRLGANAVPKVGSIAQTDAGWAGHVAIVEAVYDNGTILISEMNVAGFNVISTRVVGVGEFRYLYV